MLTYLSEVFWQLTWKLFWGVNLDERFADIPKFLKFFVDVDIFKIKDFFKKITEMKI